MSKYIITPLALLICFVTWSQTRYLQKITNDVSISKDIIFSTNIPTIETFNLFGNRIANEESYGKTRITLKMNIYEPANDRLKQRPVIIFAFGGGFVNGDRNESSMIQLCEEFAKRGFVTATIDYRLGMNLTDSELAKRAVYRALQDGRSAVRFFRKNAASYNVDPNKIFISGHSAGAFLAIHNVYLNKDSERPASTRNYFGRADLGGLDDIGDNKRYGNGSRVNGRANGVMGLAGAIGEVSYIENSSDIKGIFFHSTDDAVVPFESGEPFSFLSWIPGIDLPNVKGSGQIQRRAKNIGLKHKLNSYSNRGHGLHTNFFGSLREDIVIETSKFFYDNFLKPSKATIVPLQSNTKIAGLNYVEEYRVEGANEALSFEWDVTGGKIIESYDNERRIIIQWHENRNQKIIKVIPFSKQLVAGDEEIFKLPTTTLHHTTENNIFEIYPNPASGFINLKINQSDNQGDILISIHNTLGQKVIAQTLNHPNNTSFSIDISDLQKGMYIFKIHKLNNETIKRFLVK